MLSGKKRVLVTVDFKQASKLQYLSSHFGWNSSKTAGAAIQIGLAKLIWAHDIVHNRWETAKEKDKSEAIHWLEVTGVLPEGMFDKLEKEIDLEEERRKWRDATKAKERLQPKKKPHEN